MRIVNLFDGKDAAVHHVGGGNDVCTSLGKDEIILSAMIKGNETFAKASAWLARAALLAFARAEGLQPRL